MKRSVRKFAYVSSASVSLLLLFTSGSPVVAQQVLAQSGPSPQEQMACRSDAGKFCADHIGKPPQMNACLRDNKAKLSDACRKVVESHGG
jgi:Cysteine rich repeat